MLQTRFFLSTIFVNNHNAIAMLFSSFIIKLSFNMEETMTKTVLLSVIASTMIMAGGDIVPVEPVVAEVEADWGEVFGQSRTFYIDRTYSGILVNNRNSLATGGYIGYKSPDFNGFTAVVAAYGTYGFNIHSEDANVIGSASYDPSLYGDGFDNYAFIGQAYINYAFGNTNFKIGRQRLDTPMAGADDARMLPNLFEAAVLSNTDVENTTLIAAHVTKETTGTFSNVYGAPSALSLQSGYGLGYKEGTSGHFANMGTIALGYNDINGDGSIDNSTAGVTALAAIYTGIEGLKLQAWDYIAWDILNAVYLQADYGWNCLLSDSVKMKASAQYINETDIGDAFAASVDSNYFAAKLGASFGGLSGYAAYSVTSDSDGTMNGGIITPWGGMPAFTQGMVTRHMFFADTDTWKAAATYKFADLGLKATAYYVEFDIGQANTYKPGQAWTASESGFDIQYDVAAVKGLNLRLRANYPRDFAPGLDWDEYRLIANYSF